MATIPTPQPGNGGLLEWAQLVTQTANELADGNFRILAGQLNLTATDPITTAIGTYNRGSAIVTFPSGSFSTAPVVVCGANSGVPGTMIEASVSKVSATGFTAWLARSDTTNTIFYWIAIGATQ